MARLPRLFAPGVPCHAILRGNNRQAIFRGDGDRIFFHRCPAEIARSEDIHIHAYVMMTNHVHLLATGGHPRTLPTVFQRLGRRYVGYFNYLHGRTGTLWEGRYRSTLVADERYLFTCQRYIELNPVRAGIVDDPADFRWSSYRHHAQGLADDVVCSHRLYHELGSDPGERHAIYRDLFGEAIDEATLGQIRESLNKGWALGGPDSCLALEKEGARRTQPLPMGRPKK